MQDSSALKLTVRLVYVLFCSIKGTKCVVHFIDFVTTSLTSTMVLLSVVSSKKRRKEETDKKGNLFKY